MVPSRFRRKGEATGHEWGEEQKIEACEAKKRGMGRKMSSSCIPESRHWPEVAALEMRNCLASQLVSPQGKGGAE